MFQVISWHCYKVESRLIQRICATKETITRQSVYNWCGEPELSRKVQMTFMIIIWPYQITFIIMHLRRLIKTLKGFHKYFTDPNDMWLVPQRPHSSPKHQLCVNSLTAHMPPIRVYGLTICFPISDILLPPLHTNTCRYTNLPLSCTSVSLISYPSYIRSLVMTSVCGRMLTCCNICVWRTLTCYYICVWDDAHVL